MCRCQAKNCTVDHFNAMGVKGQRGGPQQKRKKNQFGEAFAATLA